MRLVREHRNDCHSEAAALTATTGKMGCSPDNLRVVARQLRCNCGEEPGQTPAEKLRIRKLDRESRELRQTNEIFRKGEPVNATGPREPAKAVYPLHFS